MSLGTIGAGLGAVAFSPLIVVLLHVYAYPGCMLMLAAISFNCCVAGALLRPFKEKASMIVVVQTPTQEISVADKKAPEMSNNDSSRPEAATNNITDASMPSSKSNAAGASTLNTDSCDKLSTVIPVEATPSCLTMVSQKADSAWQSLKKAVKLFKNVTMLIYCGTIFMMPVAHGMVIFFIADSAIIHGASDTQASLILSVFGGCDTVGRLAWGLVFDLKRLRSRRTMIFSILGSYSMCACTLYK